MASSSIKEFAHLQIPLEDVLKATNNFANENIIGKGDFGRVYRGQLLQSGKLLKIAARRLDRRHQQGVIEFWTEISVLSFLNHENLVSVIGFCDEKNEKIIINRHYAKGSLSIYINKPTLTWVQRLRICIGVARVLCYIHYEDGRDYSVIHRNINSSTILLDNKFVPKLSGFEYSIKYPAYRMDQVLLSEAIGTTGYMDPAIEKTKGVTHKSDIYSFGVVLWEILCGRKAFIPNEDEDKRFLASFARLHYENETLYDIIPPYLRKQMALKSLASLSKAADSCLKDERVQRPDMNSILHELENALELQMPYEDMKKNLEHLKIELNDILLATDNLSRPSVIGLTKFYKLYKADVEYIDPSFVERKITVVVKCILSIEDKRILGINSKDEEGREVFLTELEMLSTCKHRNILTLVGFCDEDSEMILVVEHLSNGYLDDYLINIKNMPILTWEKRLKICLDVARGLKYLHYEMEDQKTIILRDLKSQNIALDENWGAKIVGFGLSIFLPPNKDDEYENDAIYLPYPNGTPYYKDPEYMQTGRLKRETDVYNFGVVLFEVLCGRVASDKIYVKESDQGLAHLARISYSEGRIEEMVDSIIKEETGLNKDSLDKFIKIAYQCVALAQDQRPTMSVVVNELEHALYLQEQVQLSNKDEIEKPVELKLTQESPERVQNSNEDQVLEEVEKTIELKQMHENLRNKLEHLKIPLSEIMLATDNFSKAYHTILKKHFHIYEVELDHFDQSSIQGKNNGELPKIRNTVVLRRLNRREDKLEVEVFFKELEMLSTCKHRNIVTLLGFCDEDSEKILVVEYTSNAYVSYYLDGEKDKSILTWAKRLKICLDVAHGLKYLHYEMEDQKTIILRYVSSYNILLEENWGAKIASFAKSVFLPWNQDDDTLHLDTNLGIDIYTDPEFQESGKLKRESDVYSFGLLMFELLFGKVAYDPIYTGEGEKGLAYVARRGFNEGTLMEMIDTMIYQASGEYSFTLNRGPNKHSLDTFIKIAYQCVSEKQDQRPTMKVVVEELEKAFFYQENNKDDPRISLEDITKATRNFHHDNCIGKGGFGNVYKGKVPKGDGFDIIVAKRLDITGGQGDKQFRNELQILYEYKHENVIRHVGYCDEKDAKVIVYEYASRGSLDRYLNDPHLTWMKRLRICIDVATALEFLHGGLVTQSAVIHRDIKAENVLLNGEWKGKLADYGLSLITAINKETDYVIDHACGTIGYVDPLYLKSGLLTMESDIYSFGVVLFEILCGRSTFTIHKHEGQFLPSFIKQKFEQGKHSEVVFEAIKSQIVPKALNAFQTIAFQCLHDNRESRPTAKQVLEQLKKAMEFQENENRVNPEMI